LGKTLFVSAHPDDETLGCGGTILKLKASGEQIYWLILTNINEADGWNKQTVEERQKEIETVSGLYGFEQTSKLDFPTARLDTIPDNDLIAAISNAINMVKPHTLFLSNRSDIHTDHQVAFKSVISCTKNFRFPFIKKVLMYECLSETEFASPLPETAFTPNVHIDITDHLEKKLEIMKTYKSEVMPPPGPRSLDTIKALARYRGSRIGVEYAEAFMLIQEIL